MATLLLLVAWALTLGAIMVGIAVHTTIDDMHLIWSACRTAAQSAPHLCGPDPTEGFGAWAPWITAGGVLLGALPLFGLANALDRLDQLLERTAILDRAAHQARDRKPDA